MSSEGAGKDGNEERKVKRDGGDGENVPRARGLEENVPIFPCWC